MAQTASNLSGHAHPAPPPPATSTGPKKQEPKKAPRKAPRAKKQKITHDRPLPSLAPAPPRPQPLPQVEQLILDTNLEPPKPKDIYDLPAEIRVEIYKLVLDDVVVHVIPSKSENDRFLPHALVRTSRVVRNEVLPIMHATCAIQVEITNFNFTGLMQFMKRIPPDDHKYLVQNDRLCIHLNTTQKEAKGNSTIVGDSASLRNWLSWRADTCKPQARWEYDGPYPGRKVDSELKRRVKRMTEVEKKGEMIKMVEAIGVVIPENQSER